MSLAGGFVPLRGFVLIVVTAFVFYRRCLLLSLILKGPPSCGCQMSVESHSLFTFAASLAGAGSAGTLPQVMVSTQRGATVSGI